MGLASAAQARMLTLRASSVRRYKSVANRGHLTTPYTVNSRY